MDRLEAERTDLESTRNKCEMDAGIPGGWSLLQLALRWTWRSCDAEQHHDHCDVPSHVDDIHLDRRALPPATAEDPACWNCESYLLRADGPTDLVDFLPYFFSGKGCPTRLTIAWEKDSLVLEFSNELFDVFCSPDSFKAHLGIVSCCKKINRADSKHSGQALAGYIDGTNVRNPNFV